LAKPYETVVVVDAMIPDESIASEFDAVAKLIESQGKLVKLDRWGKRNGRPSSTPPSGPAPIARP